MQLKDIGVIVTGGGSGLGAATARAMATKGAKVTILDINKQGADAVAAEIGGLAVAADVVSEDSVTQAIVAAEAAHGVTRILVNCAGTGDAIRIISKKGVFPLAAFKRIVDIN